MRHVLVLFLTLLLSGCVRGEGITTDRRDSIRNVAVVTILEDRLEAISPSILRFLNEDFVIETPEWEVDAKATAILVDRLRQYRPDLNVVVPEIDRPSLTAIHHVAALSHHADPDRIKDKLTAIGRSTGADAILVVARDRAKKPYFANMPNEGLGILVNMQSGERLYGTFYAELCMFLIDARSGETLARLSMAEIDERYRGSIFMPEPAFRHPNPTKGPLSDNHRAALLEDVEGVMKTALLNGIDAIGLYTPPPKPES